MNNRLISTSKLTDEKALCNLIIVICDKISYFDLGATSIFTVMEIAEW